MDISKEILDRLDAISVKVGEGTEYFWPKLVHQQILEGCLYVGVPILVVIVLLVLRSIIKRHCERKDTNGSFWNYEMIV